MSLRLIFFNKLRDYKFNYFCKCEFIETRKKQYRTFLKYSRLLTPGQQRERRSREMRHALSSRGNKGSTVGRSVDQRNASSSHPFYDARMIVSHVKMINYTIYNDYAEIIIFRATHLQFCRYVFNLNARVVSYFYHIIEKLFLQLMSYLL